MYYSYLCSIITTPGKELFMRKLKCEAGRKKKLQQFPANFAGFEQAPDRVSRLIKKQQIPQRRAFVNRDE